MIVTISLNTSKEINQEGAKYSTTIRCGHDSLKAGYHCWNPITAKRRFLQYNPSQSSAKIKNIKVKSFESKIIWKSRVQRNVSKSSLEFVTGKPKPSKRPSSSRANQTPKFSPSRSDTQV